jgi:hypothetical protein
VELDSSLISALVGALVGGAASLAGSFLVARRDLIRRTRIRMYDEVVPNLQRQVTGDLSRGQSNGVMPISHCRSSDG